MLFVCFVSFVFEYKGENGVVGFDGFFVVGVGSRDGLVDCVKGGWGGKFVCLLLVI